MHRIDDMELHFVGVLKQDCEQRIPGSDWLMKCESLLRVCCVLLDQRRQFRIVGLGYILYTIRNRPDSAFDLGGIGKQFMDGRHIGALFVLRLTSAHG